MNPLLQGFLTRVLQFALAGLFGWLVQKGVLTDAESQTYMTAAIAGIIALAWMLWEKYKDRLKLTTAMATQRPVSERQVEMLIQMGQAPPASLPKERVPYLEGKKPTGPLAPYRDEDDTRPL